MVVLCQLNEFGLSCFGCCGKDYSHKKKLMRDIHKNTVELKNSKSISSFMSRTNNLKSSGICANLIIEDGKFVCPGHPAMNHGRDYRNLDPACEKEFVCKTYGLFQKWDEEKQQRFLDFLKEKKLDSFTYSIKMDNDSLLEEFEKKLKEKIKMVAGSGIPEEHLSVSNI